MSKLASRLLAVDDALARAGLPHAFGGAIALAYCTQEPRGTRDIDVNVFVGADRADEVLDALPEQVVVRTLDRIALQRDDQVRVWWDDTPVDIFLDAHPFHRDVATRVREVPFEGRTIRVLDCQALIVFKAMFNRTRDWADIEAMTQAGIDARRAVRQLGDLLGADDAIVERLALLSTQG